MQASDTSSFFFVFTYILLYFSELEDGLQAGIGAPSLDKSKLRPPDSPEESSAMSEMEEGGLTTCSKFVSGNFSCLFLYTKKNRICVQLVFQIIEFPFPDVLHHWIDLAAKEGCTFPKDIVDLMDHLMQGDNLTADGIEIITNHLDVAKDTQFADVTEDSNGHDANEFQTSTQPMVSQFLHFFVSNASKN